MACKFFRMVSANIILDTRYKKKGDVYPLKLRVVHNRKSFDLGLGHSVSAKDWDEKGQKVKSSCKTIDNVTRFNALLGKEKQKAQDILIEPRHPFHIGDDDVHVVDGFDHGGIVG